MLPVTLNGGVQTSVSPGLNTVVEGPIGILEKGTTGTSVEVPALMICRVVHGSTLWIKNCSGCPSTAWASEFDIRLPNEIANCEFLPADMSVLIVVMTGERLPRLTMTGTGVVDAARAGAITAFCGS